jgi:hypothetical protein
MAVRNALSGYIYSANLAVDHFSEDKLELWKIELIHAFHPSSSLRIILILVPVVLRTLPGTDLLK